MPVSSVAAAPQPVQQPTAAPPAPSDGGFEAVLARAALRVDATNLPTVSLGQMVHALAAGTSAPPAVSGLGMAGAGGVAPAATVGAAVDGSRGDGNAVLAAGERYLGVPYKWGGTDPRSGFDCSGFVQRVFADLGVRLPRVSVDQARSGTRVDSLAEARPGDLVFWRSDGRRPNHIGIYAGNGEMLVAPRTGDVVRYQEIRREPHEIRRVI